MLADWHLHYFGYVIGDGEPERDVDEVFDWFAVAFWSSATMGKARDRKLAAIPIADYRYRVIGQVAFLSAEACVLDFGLRAVGSRRCLPDDCTEGDYVTGGVGLELPLCTELVPETIVPTLKCSWHVHNIVADVTPMVAGSDRKTWIRDDSRIDYRDVNSTRSIRAQDYVLHCSIVR